MVSLDTNVEITLQGVSKSFDGKVALHPTDLEVGARTRVVLIGPSGCGKSTLLRLVVGLLEPDGGRIEIGGRAMGADTRRALRLRMGYVIQEGGLFPHLTAEENVTLLAQDQRWEPSRIQERLRELAQLTGITADLFGRYPAQLSGGQRQRVGLMRALMLDPEVLLMDEPLGALDPMIRARLQEDLRDLFDRLQKTVVLVTHDMAEAVYLGETIVLMREGRVVQTGAPLDLTERPADPFVSEFIRAQRTLHGEA
jgi:osmoprotectant transport system ATP-binding protein